MPDIRTIVFSLLTLLCYPVAASTSGQPFEFVHCYDFGCKSTQYIHFDKQQWENIQRIFTMPALSAWMERQQIRKAIALMETYAGKMTGTDQDRARNHTEEEVAQQQDCIDESTNSLQYLNALLNRNLLVWHDLAYKKRRIVWFVTHWTAVIQEKDSQQSYAVDSWYRNNGEPPYVQRLDDWKRKRAFADLLNP